MKWGAIDSLFASALGAKVPWSRIPFACAGNKRDDQCLPVATGLVRGWSVDVAYLVGSLGEGRRYRGAYQPILG